MYSPCRFFTNMVIGSSVVLLTASSVYASESYDNAESRAIAGDRYATYCTPTPSLSTYSAPASNTIPTSNKLARPAGKSAFADGQRLYLRGRVFDGACVPLRDAKVEIWHADAQGIYRRVDNEDLSNPYPVFAGSGQVKTDNRGEYVFETIMPGTKGDAPPKIHIRVMHPAMPAALITTMYFEGDKRNFNDKAFTGLSGEMKDRVTAHVMPLDDADVNNGLLAQHDITVRGRDGFRGF